MPNPDRHEITFELGEGSGAKRYLLTFNNAGRRAAEDTLGMEWPEIGEKINESGPGYRIQSGLFFGATRKYHRRDVPNMAAVDAVMDKVEDSDEETVTDFLATLMALFFQGEKETWRKILSGEDLEAELEEDGPAEEADSEEAESPREPEAPKASGKRSSSRSGAGKSSS